jgi:hypothetical protein
MAASRNDSYVLGTNAAFLGRVQASMVAACVAIAAEGSATANHIFRIQLVHAILSSPTSQANYATMFALTVATDTTVLADATQGGTVALGANVGTQQALVTDAHIDTAVAGQFTAYCQGIQG